jgi:hypothetical protein
LSQHGIKECEKDQKPPEFEPEPFSAVATKSDNQPQTKDFKVINNETSNPLTKQI